MEPMEFEYNSDLSEAVQGRHLVTKGKLTENHMWSIEWHQ